jgi:hypothetical protein
MVDDLSLGDLVFPDPGPGDKRDVAVNGVMA